MKLSEMERRVFRLMTDGCARSKHAIIEKLFTASLPVSDVDESLESLWDAIITLREKDIIRRIGIQDDTEGGVEDLFAIHPHPMFPPQGRSFKCRIRPRPRKLPTDLNLLMANPPSEEM